MMFHNYKIKIAFTLVEVLITLMVVGVIASLTIPVVVKKTNNAQYVTKLKKEFSALQQAFDMIAADSPQGSIAKNPNFTCSGSFVACMQTPSANAMNEFANKLKVIRNCGNGMGCWHTDSLKYLGGTATAPNFDSDNNGYYGKAVLADGTMMTVQIYNSNCTVNAGSGSLNSSTCGVISIDVNGASGPNTLGRDTFHLWITQTGIYPAGILNDGQTCDTSSNTWATSQGCAGKVITEGAMNY